MIKKIAAWSLQFSQIICNNQSTLDIQQTSILSERYGSGLNRVQFLFSGVPLPIFPIYRGTNSNSQRHKEDDIKISTCCIDWFFHNILVCVTVFFIARAAYVILVLGQNKWGAVFVLWCSSAYFPNILRHQQQFKKA